MSEWNIIKVTECLSTNNLTKEKKKETLLRDKTALLTDFQSGGKGQGSNIWHSELGLNLLVSLYKKTNVDVQHHFMLNIITSLAIKQTLEIFSIKAQIKWPNDIYIGENKVAGILIENSLMRDKIEDSIIGIGLNVNQTIFPDTLPNPISIAGAIKNKVNIEQLLTVLLGNFDTLFDLSKKTQSAEELFHTYTENLYRRKQWSVYRASGKNFTGNIRGILPDGRLIVETEGGQLHYYLFGDIEYVI